MEFGFDKGPHLKDTDHTAKIMRRLSVVLLTIILFAEFKNGILPFIKGSSDFYGAMRPLVMIISACFTSLITEIMYFRFIIKEKELLKKVRESNAIFPGLFLVLCLPLYTPLWIVILGSFVATFIGKLIFGGLGYNVFNPALVGVLFVLTSYGALITANGGYLNPLEVDTIAGATPLSNLSNINYIGTYDNIVGEYGTFWDFFLGFVPGTLGETSKLVIVMGFIYLTVTKVIKWIIPVSYISVVFIMTLIIGQMNDMGLWYPLFHIMSGGLLFGATLMATDPVTSPTTKSGQLLYGLCLGLLTVLFRYLTPYPEGVATSILTMNMLVFILDQIGSKGIQKFLYRYLPLSLLIISILGFSIYVGKEVEKPSEPVDTKFKIIEVTKKDNKTIYNVTQVGFHGLIKANVTIVNDKVESIDITSQDETYWNEIERNNYLEQIISNQEDLEELDTISGATISSNALKSMIRKIIEDYEVRE